MPILKKRLLVLVILPVILFHTIQALAFNTIRVAILPPLGLSQQSEKEALSMIHEKLTGRFKFPYYENIPVPAVDTQFTRPVNTKASIRKEPLAKYAADLKAEIIILPYIERLDGRIISTFDGDATYEEFDVRVVCYIYSAQTDKLLTIRAVRQGTLPVSVYTGALPALADALDEILTKIPFASIPSQQAFTLFK